MDVLHAAVWVSDLETTVAFYEDLFELTDRRESTGADGETNCWISGETDTELQFKYDPDGQVDINPGSLDHLAVEVEDVDATVERAVDEWGSSIVDEPRSIEEKGIRIAFITDPDGYTVEVIQHTE